MGLELFLIDLGLVVVSNNLPVSFETFCICKGEGPQVLICDTQSIVRNEGGPGELCRYSSPVIVLVVLRKLRDAKVEQLGDRQARPSRLATIAAIKSIRMLDTKIKSQHMNTRFHARRGH